MIRYSPDWTTYNFVSGKPSKGINMNLRLFASTKGWSVVALMLSILVSSAVQANGPEYTYASISYEWTDVKYGLNPKVDDRFNNGDIAGENFDISVGILPWLHLKGQAFGYANGKCNNCKTDLGGGTSDSDIEGFKVGVGINLGLDLIGLSEDVDLVIRGNWVDTELSTLNIASPDSISEDGWSAEAAIRGRISDRADVHVGYEYYDLGSDPNDVTNRNVTIGLNYQVWDGISVLVNGIIFDSETGFELGLRWHFGSLLLDGRDSIF
jgi:hypothetical protein